MKNTAKGSTSAEDVEMEITLATDSKKKLRHRVLYRAALDGDWKRAEKYYNDPIDIGERISKNQDTALHIAVMAERTAFVKKLVKKINKDNLDILGMRNKIGNTPFCLAAVCGSVGLAELMRKKKEELVRSTSAAASKKIEYNKGAAADVTIEANINLDMICGLKNMLPLEIAALFCQEKMVKFLYKSDAVNSLDDRHRFHLLANLINAGFYDFALDLVEKHPDLAIARGENEETALHALARMPTANQKGFWERCLNPCSYMFRKTRLAPEAVELVKCIWKLVLENSEISEFIRKPERRKLIFVAAERGNTEFLKVLIHEHPDLIFEMDQNKHTIFHYAVKYRQDGIFKLIYNIGSFKDLIAPITDINDNNILHLAGMLAPPNRLNIVSGAALQLQRELLWFKEVNQIMNKLDTETENKGGKTPRALFTQRHRKLKEEGEKWMKDTASSCMIVATLIATMVFTAAFTVPGGTKETGAPNFLKKASFRIFAISDAISLVSSSCSILTFLSILTSRYAEDDFILLLPIKLIIGVATLFISIVTMMVVFCATFFIVFDDGMPGIAVLATGIASIPVILFMYQQSRIVRDLSKSTFLVLSSSCKTVFSAKKGRAMKL